MTRSLWLSYSFLFRSFGFGRRRGISLMGPARPPPRRPSSLSALLPSLHTCIICISILIPFSPPRFFLFLVPPTRSDRREYIRAMNNAAKWFTIRFIDCIDDRRAIVRTGGMRRQHAHAILFLMFKHLLLDAHTVARDPFSCRFACMIRNQICRLHRADRRPHCSAVASCSARYYQAAREESIRSLEDRCDKIEMDSLGALKTVICMLRYISLPSHFALFRIRKENRSIR